MFALHAFSVSALLVSTVLFVAQGSCEYALVVFSVLLFCLCCMAATATEQSSNAEEISVVGDAWLGLPESVRAALSPDGRRPTADTLDCLFADAADRRDFLAGFAADADELQLLLRLMLHLEAGSAQQALLCRKRRAREDPAMQFLAVELKRRAMACAPAVESYQWLVSCSGAKQRQSSSAWRCISSQKQGSRTVHEAGQLQRWRSKLACILVAAKAPALRGLCASPEDLEERAARLAGCARTSTIKQRVQMWCRYCKWLRCAYQVDWPSNAAMVLDFIEELAAQPCGHTVPQSFLATLAFMENAAGLQAECRLSKLGIVQKSIEQIAMELEQGVPPPKKAKLQPLLLIIALELWVVSEEAPKFSRAFAWTRLVKLWTCSRCDDLLGLLPTTMELQDGNLCALLRRTKTSGPGKRLKWLPIFVDGGASFSGVSWLSCGFKIWQEPEFCFDRDFLIPLPANSWESCRNQFADYAAISAMAKQLYAHLRLPILGKEGWYLSSSATLLTSFAAGRAWTEHSERAWLDSIAAIAGIPREQREFLGRWRASACVDEYVRTAQQTVCGLQRNIVQLVLAGQVHGASSLRLRDLREHLSSAGLDQAAIVSQLALFDLGNWISQPTSMPPQVLLPAVPQEDAPADEEVAGVRKFFVCVTKNRSFRRLHRWGGCGSSPGRNVQEFEGFDSLDGVLYDAACKHCWKQGVLEADNADGSSASESTDDSLASD